MKSSAAMRARASSSRGSSGVALVPGGAPMAFSTFVRK
jgi:hypothetical protein